MSSQTSSRNSAVKATLKVYSEMREDQSCKLAMRFTQLRIVLATHKILGVCHKIKSVRLQHYFDVLLLTKTQNTSTINKPQQAQIQYLTPPTKRKNAKFQSKQINAPCQLLKLIINKHVRRYFNILQQNQNQKIKKISFNDILNHLFTKKKIQIFKLLKTRLLQSQKFKRIDKIINKKIKFKQFEVLLTISQYVYNNYNMHTQQVSLLDSEFSQQNQLNQEPPHEHEIGNQMMSAKEQLAMKFASTSLLIGILSQVMIKAQFAFLLHLRSEQNQKLDIREVKSIDISDNLDQTLIEEEKIKPKIIAANQINHFLIQKFRQYFEQINQVSSRVIRPSIKIFKGDKRHKIQPQNLKLMILGQKIFKEDETQQKSTDITVNEKKGSFKALPGVRYVTQFSDISKNTLSDSEVTQKSVITNCVNTLENIQTSVILINQKKQFQQHKSNDKKDKLNSAIQQYLSPIKTQDNTSQKINKKTIEQRPEKKFSNFKLIYCLPIIIIIFIGILIK